MTQMRSLLSMQFFCMTPHSSLLSSIPSLHPPHFLRMGSNALLYRKCPYLSPKRGNLAWIASPPCVVKREFAFTEKGYHDALNFCLNSLSETHGFNKKLEGWTGKLTWFHEKIVTMLEKDEQAMALVESGTFSNWPDDFTDRFIQTFPEHREKVS